MKISRMCSCQWSQSVIVSSTQYDVGGIVCVCWVLGILDGVGFFKRETPIYFDCIDLLSLIAFRAFLDQIL